MIEKRSITCIVCPIGCSMDVVIEKGKIRKIEGNQCIRGANYAKTECINPVRILTSTVKVAGGVYRLVPVKSQKPLPKDMVLLAMDIIKIAEAAAPVRIGDLIIGNILDTGIDIIASGNVESEKGVIS